MAEPAIPSSLSLSVVLVFSLRNQYALGPSPLYTLAPSWQFPQLPCRSTRIIGAAPAVYKVGFRLLERLLNLLAFSTCHSALVVLLRNLLEAIATAR